MRIRAILFPMIIGLASVSAVIGLLAYAALPTSAAEELPEETTLPGATSVYEINRDAGGHLWISDFDGGAIWQVNPASGAYTVYQGLQAPSDARRDPLSHVWWADGLEAQFGRLDPATGSVTRWRVHGVGSLYGTQIDDAGQFWVVAWAEPFLYRFEADSSQLCSFGLPDEGTADYPLAHDGFMWLGDNSNGRILRLDPELSEYAYWELPAGSAPEGMVFDDAGSLWWSDPGRGLLAQLRPESGRLDNFYLPSGSLPMMVSARAKDIWYTEQWENAVGRLDWSIAGHTTVTLTQVMTQTSFSCGQIAPLATGTVPSVTGNLTWMTTTYSLLVDGGGWQVRELPDGSAPWGITNTPEGIYFVDTGRGVLGRIPLEPPADPATVTACKVEDADGDLSTTGDRTPLENWSIDLRLDGVAQGITQTTSPDGCTTWADLLPGPAYGVQEKTVENWIALTPTSHDFGPATSGGAYTNTFANTQEVTVGACKVEDADGDPGTTGDLTPVKEWGIDLRIDGVAQGITQTTGLTGCLAWDGLAPGHTYGVQEQAMAGWLALTSPNHDFPEASSGDVFSHTFSNSRYAAVTACKLRDEDGDLNTTDGQQPLPNWTIFLTVEGVKQLPGQTTGADGCATWQELIPGISYGVEEEVPAGWHALTPAKHDFDPAASGASLSHTFINAKKEEWFLFLPLLTR